MRKTLILLLLTCTLLTACGKKETTAVELPPNAKTEPATPAEIPELPKEARSEEPTETTEPVKEEATIAFVPPLEYLPLTDKEEQLLVNVTTVKEWKAYDKAAMLKDVEESYAYFRWTAADLLDGLRKKDTREIDQGRLYFKALSVETPVGAGTYIDGMLDAYETIRDYNPDSISDDNVRKVFVELRDSLLADTPSYCRHCTLYNMFNKYFRGEVTRDDIVALGDDGLTTLLEEVEKQEVYEDLDSTAYFGIYDITFEKTRFEKIRYQAKLFLDLMEALGGERDTFYHYDDECRVE